MPPYPKDFGHRFIPTKKLLEAIKFRQSNPDKYAPLNRNLRVVKKSNHNFVPGMATMKSYIPDQKRIKIEPTADILIEGFLSAIYEKKKKLKVSNSFTFFGGDVIITKPEYKKMLTARDYVWDSPGKPVINRKEDPFPDKKFIPLAFVGESFTSKNIKLDTTMKMAELYKQDEMKEFFELYSRIKVSKGNTGSIIPYISNRIPLGDLEEESKRISARSVEVKILNKTKIGNSFNGMSDTAPSQIAELGEMGGSSTLSEDSSEDVVVFKAPKDLEAEQKIPENEAKNKKSVLNEGNETINQVSSEDQTDLDAQNEADPENTAKNKNENESEKDEAGKKSKGPTVNIAEIPGEVFEQLDNQIIDAINAAKEKFKDNVPKDTLLEKMDIAATRVLSHRFKPKSRFFGSASVGLGMSESDIDIAILYDHPRAASDRTYTKKFIFDLLKSVRLSGFVSNSAATPLAKLMIKYLWQNTHIQVNVSGNNYNGVVRTNLTRAYLKADPRVGPLLMILKIWTSRRLLNDSGKLTDNYGYSLMMLSYLIEQKVVPNLQKICCLTKEQQLQSTEQRQDSYTTISRARNTLSVGYGTNSAKTRTVDSTKEDENIYELKYGEYSDDFNNSLTKSNEPKENKENKNNGRTHSPCVCENCKKGVTSEDKYQKKWYFYHPEQRIRSNNQKSVAELFIGFFHYYAYEHSYLTDVVSLKMGSTRANRENFKNLDRAEVGDKINNTKLWKHMVRLLAIEDPIDTDVNVGRNIPPWAVEGIRAEMKRAYEILSTDKGLPILLRLFKIEDIDDLKFWYSEYDITVPILEKQL